MLATIPVLIFYIIRMAGEAGAETADSLVISMAPQAVQLPNDSGSGSEQEIM